MYHAIVKRKLRRAFEAINGGRYHEILPEFGAHHRHVLFGSHALGGERVELEATRAWYERLSRLFPDLKFTIDRIAVAGFPWDTTAMVEWTDSFSVGKERGANQGVHVFRLRWGKVVELRIHCDTSKLERYLAEKASHGQNEALASPITTV